MFEKKQMNQQDPEQFVCPIRATLSVIGGKWKSIILFYLFVDGVHRFSDLRRKLPEISDQVLTKQLRELEANGIVERKAYAEIPARVEYSMTEYGRTLQPIADAMCDWGMEFIAKQDGSMET